MPIFVGPWQSVCDGFTCGCVLQFVRWSSVRVPATYWYKAQAHATEKAVGRLVKCRKIATNDIHEKVGALSRESFLFSVACSIVFVGRLPRPTPEACLPPP